MKKILLAAVAAGSLAAMGAASAQGLGGVLNNIFGHRGPTYSDNGAVVAGTGTRVYRDQDGRPYGYGGPVYSDNGAVVAGSGTRIYYDPNGRPYINGRPVDVGPDIRYEQTGTDQWGRPIYRAYELRGAGAPPSQDRDGDGWANDNDRSPDDPLHW